jgi:hypothetical protein
MFIFVGGCGTVSSEGKYVYTELLLVLSVCTPMSVSYHDSGVG